MDNPDLAPGGRSHKRQEETFLGVRYAQKPCGQTHSRKDKLLTGMGTRGRTSMASLSVVQTGLETQQRPAPPAELSTEQRMEWLAVVNRLPADWFQPENYPMLAQYCRHVVSARRVAELIATLEAEMSREPGEGESKAELMFGATKAMDRLLKMQEREGRAMSSLATRMRLTQQSTYDPKRKKPSQEKRPWE